MKHDYTSNSDKRKHFILYFWIYLLEEGQIIASFKTTETNMIRLNTLLNMNIARNHRKCSKCGSNDIQDAYHFILVCPYFIVLRNTFISNHFTHNPSMYKFLQLSNSSKRKEIMNLADFCIKAFKKLEQP